MEGCCGSLDSSGEPTQSSPGAWINSGDNKTRLVTRSLGFREKWIKLLEAIMFQTGLWGRGFALGVNSAFCRTHPFCRGSDPHPHPKEP